MDRIFLGKSGEVEAESPKAIFDTVLGSRSAAFARPAGLLGRLAGTLAEAERAGPSPPSGVSFDPSEAFRHPVDLAFDVDRNVIDRRPPGRPRIPFPPPVSKTASQLARSSIVNLTQATSETVREAVNTITIKHPAADTLLDYLERKVRVGEVLNQLAATWSATTVGDFADAFQMDRSKTDVMDAIVSISILSNPKLDEEILAENLPDAAPHDLLDNRVIVDQWPERNSAMNPPYVILVAVEYRDVAHAEDVVESIMGELVGHQGMKLPRAALEKL